MFCCDLTFVFRVGELTTPEVISASTEIPLLPPMPPQSPNPVSVYDIPLLSSTPSPALMFRIYHKTYDPCFKLYHFGASQAYECTSFSGSSILF